MSHLELTGLSKSFGTTKVLNDVSLSVRNGEFLTLVGASGCGKSTILRVIAGLEPQDSGTVQIGGRGVDHLSTILALGVTLPRNCSKAKTMRFPRKKPNLNTPPTCKT